MATTHTPITAPQESVLPRPRAMIAQVQLQRFVVVFRTRTVGAPTDSAGTYFSSPAASSVSGWTQHFTQSPFCQEGPV